MLTRSIDIKLGVLLIIGFILFTPIGTVSHEFGHYSAARALGYKSNIHYGSSGSYNKANNRYIDSIYKKYPNEIDSGLNFPDRAAFDAMIKQRAHDAFLITLGGPLQTTLTGTIGLIFLLIYRKRFYTAVKLNTKQWLLIFITLFWLRELFNFVHGILIYVLNGRFPAANDEVRLARHLELNTLSITMPAAVIASLILAFVVFKVIPVQQRLTFMMAGIIGGLLGFYLWLYLIGPVIMP